MVAGSVVVPLEIDTNEVNPWDVVAGMFRDEPLFDEYELAEFDRQAQVGW